MKILVVTVFFALLAAGAFAQTTQGTMAVAGNVSLSGQGTDHQDGNNKGIVFQVTPIVGYFYKDRLEVGIISSFRFSRDKAESINEEQQLHKSYYTTIGPFVQKYIPITEKLFFTAGGDVQLGYGRGKNKIEPEESFHKTDESFTFTIGTSPGLVYFATEKLGFSINVGRAFFYTATTKYPSSDSKTTDTFFRADISPASSTIGIRYVFTR